MYDHTGRQNCIRKAHPTMATPQPFHTRSLQVTAMQVTKPGAVIAIAEWMNRNGARIDDARENYERGTFSPVESGIIRFRDDTHPARLFILNHHDWVVFDGHTFNSMTNHQFNTYHHTTANS